MAITKGNLTTESNQTGFGGSQTISHDQDTGSDGLLTVMFTIPSNVTINSVEYDGVGMTLQESTTFNSVTYRFYTLASPSTGTNNLVIDTNTSFALTRVAIQSFTGTVLGTTQKATDTSSPVQDTITVSTDSKIYLIGMYNTTGAADTIDVGGTDLTEDYKLQFIYTFIAGLSATQTSGSKNTEHTYSLGSNGALFSIELEEPGGGPTPTLRRNRCIVV